MSLTLSSSEFKNNETIPRKYTCDGDDISPPLTWSVAPEGTRSLALIVDDPDAPAGIWVHWVIYDIPAQLTALPQNVAKSPTVQGIGNQGTNDSRKTGFSGPCPPRGKAHRYVFKLYAVDTLLNLKPGASKADVERAMRGHILAQGQLVGLYSR